MSNNFSSDYFFSQATLNHGTHCRQRRPGFAGILPVFSLHGGTRKGKPLGNSSRGKTSNPHFPDNQPATFNNLL
jgi:hypothetical protein